jgi:1-phosphofructokinase
MKPSVITVTMNPALDKTVSVEKLQLGVVNRIKESRTDAGGKGINVAKVLKGFGVKVSAWGIAGGYQGRMIRNKLEQAGISVFFVDAPGETRVNLKVVDESTRVTTEINEPGMPVDEEMLQRFKDLFNEGIDTAGIVVLGGSLPPGAPSGYYAELIRAAHLKNVMVVLDADGEAFAKGVEASPFAVKPNIHEMESYFKRTLKTDAELVEAARHLILHKGIKLVQVSMGSQGSILVNASQAFRARPFPIEPVSTVGAGDSMVAAMVYGLLKGLPLESIARLSSAAGTITASKHGTQVCSLDEVEAGKDQIEVYPL